MNEIEERKIQCPYCGEYIDILVDCSDIGQTYIEDCQVCCQPINFSIRTTETGKLTVFTSHENE